jgi:hypothetical protein
VSTKSHGIARTTERAEPKCQAGASILARLATDCPDGGGADGRPHNPSIPGEDGT